MAAYIQLINKETKAAETFVSIDSKICQHFGTVEDPVHFYREWYQMICFPLALGDTYDVIRKRWDGYGDVDPIDYQILSWLEERYEPNAWHAR